MEWHPLERDFTAYSLVLFSNRSNKNKNIFSSPDFARRKRRNPLKQIFSILILVSLLILFFALFYTFYISASTLDVAHSQSPGPVCKAQLFTCSLWCRRWFLFGHVLSRSMSLTQGRRFTSKKYWKFSFKWLTVDSWHAYKSHTSLLIAMCSYKNTNLPKREVAKLYFKNTCWFQAFISFFSGRSFSCCLHWGVKMRMRDVDAVGANSGLAPNETQEHPRHPTAHQSTPLWERLPCC